MAWHDRKRKKYHYSWYFHTRSSERFGLLHQYFYQDGIKILPENIFELITPRALAVWFMDDGSNTKESLTLSTHCFSRIDQLRIIRFLREHHDIATTLIKDRSKLKIRIGKSEYQKFINLVEPFIIPSMNYKIVIPVTTSQK